MTPAGRNACGLAPEAARYLVLSLVMRVAQLPRLARVPPHVPNGAALYCV